MPTHASLHAGVRALPDVGHALGCKFEKVGVVYCSISGFPLTLLSPIDMQPPSQWGYGWGSGRHSTPQPAINTDLDDCQRLGAQQQQAPMPPTNYSPTAAYTLCDPYPTSTVYVQPQAPYYFGEYPVSHYLGRMTKTKFSPFHHQMNAQMLTLGGHHPSNATYSPSPLEHTMSLHFPDYTGYFADGPLSLTIPPLKGQHQHNPVSISSGSSEIAHALMEIPVPHIKEDVQVHSFPSAGVSHSGHLHHRQHVHDSFHLVTDPTMYPGYHSVPPVKVCISPTLLPLSLMLTSWGIAATSVPRYTSLACLFS